MSIISLWQIVFKYVFFFAAVSYMIMSCVEESSERKKESNKPSKQHAKGMIYDVIQFAILIVAIVIFMIGCMYIAINQELFWLLAIVVIFEVLDKIAGAFVSIGIVGDLVKDNTKGTLSSVEHTAIFTISFVVMILQAMNCFDYCNDCVNKCFDSITSDLLVLLLYVMTLYTYIFLTCALVSVLISLGTKLVMKVKKHILRKGKIKRCGDFFAERTNLSLKQSKLTVLLIKWLIKRNVFIKIICIPFIVIAVALDIVAIFILFMFSIMIAVVGYLVIIYRLVSKAIKKVIHYIVDLSGKKIIAISFRVAIIAALVITVIANRYETFVEDIENSTAVLEFVASSIVIPVVFEWINSSGNKLREVK